MPRSAPSSEAVMGLNDHRADRGRALALVWAGMVLGVSFLATPAKFLALSLSLPVALDVGRHTFRTFGRVEMAVAAPLGLRVGARAWRRLLALAPGLIVLAQALWLQPRLDVRTRQVVPDSTMIHCGAGFSCQSPTQPTGWTVTTTVEGCSECLLFHCGAAPLTPFNSNVVRAHCF